MVLRIRLIPLLTLLLSSVRQTWGFATKTSDLVAMRRRALSKASPSKTNATRLKKSVQPKTTRNQLQQQRLSKAFILEVVEEALFRQQTAIEALDREVERRQEMEETENESLATINTIDIDNEIAPQERTYSESKEKRTIDFSRVQARRQELCDIDTKLHTIMQQTKTGRPTQNALQNIKQQISGMGYKSIFHQPQSAWKTTIARTNEFGRPQNFDGDIFYTQLGVPILVGRIRAHKDEIMRNAAQGSDLWFQVEDYEGSRVLLRTSLIRGTAGSKGCIQMAADLAAKYSVWGEGNYDCIPVMYTDSRKVAKRGSRIGGMKKSKSLGRIMGYPRNV